MLAGDTPELRELYAKYRQEEHCFDIVVEATCKDRKYGARPLRRAIQRHIEDALSEKVIRGELLGAGDVEVRLDNGSLVFAEMDILKSLKD